MKQGYVVWMTMLVLLALSLFCPNSIAVAGDTQYTNTIQKDKMLIVIAAPSVEDPYYEEAFQGIIEFDISYAKAVMDHDNIIVLADKETIPYLQDHLPDDVILEAEVLDIWMRDFTTVHPNKMVQFVYDRPEETYIQESFNYFLKENEVKFKRSKLKVDGGNVVDNGAGKVILTDKVFQRNPDLTEEEVLIKIEKLLGATEIAIIPMDDEYLGHSDGMAMFVEDNTLLVNTYHDEPALKQEILTNLKEYLANIKIVEIEGSGYGEKHGKYASACGIYVNSVVTNNYIYTPIFGSAKDKHAVETIQHNTDKTVITINAEEVCYLGGNVRCLSWQLTGNNAKNLIEAARHY